MIYAVIAVFSKENKVLSYFIFKLSIKEKLTGDKNSPNY